MLLLLLLLQSGFSHGSHDCLGMTAANPPPGFRQRGVLKVEATFSNAFGQRLGDAVHDCCDCRTESGSEPSVWPSVYTRV